MRAPLAGDREGEAARLEGLRPVRFSRRARSPPDLEEPDVRRAVAQVARHGVEEPGQQRRPQMPPRRVERVDERAAARGPCSVSREPAPQGRSSASRSTNGIAHRLEEARGRGRVGQPLLDLAAAAPEVPAGAADGRQARGQPVVAVDAQDLFDEVVLAAHVPAEERNRHGEVLAPPLRREPEPRERLLGEVEGEPVVAGQQPQAREAQRRLPDAERRAVRVQEARSDGRRPRPRRAAAPPGRAPRGSRRGRRPARSGATRPCACRGAARSCGWSPGPTRPPRAARSSSAPSRPCRARP